MSSTDEIFCTCGLCGGPITDPEKMIMAGNQAYHCDCHGAKSHFDRCCDRDPDAHLLRAWRKAQPQEARYKALELRMAGKQQGDLVPTQRRGAAERQLVANIIAEIKAFSLMQRRARVFLLGRASFILYHMREMDMSRADAEAKWEVDKKEKYSCKEFGELKVAVRGHTVLEHITGREQSHRQNLGPARSFGDLDGSPDAAAFDGVADVNAIREQWQRRSRQSRSAQSRSGRSRSRSGGRRARSVGRESRASRAQSVSTSPEPVTTPGSKARRPLA